MKEVQLKRYAGPFKNIPFENYIQSPIGLVPKDGGKKTRLIFHLSYPRKVCDGVPKSVNGNTPKHICTVKYCDFNQAVQLYLSLGKNCKVGKFDMSSAFRHLCIKKAHWKFLVMKAESPFDQQIYYFIDKCLPFGAAISCAHFQLFSDAVAHIVMIESDGQVVINCLDNYFFAGILKIICNNQVRIFLKICAAIRFPVALEKTFWATTRITFLGLVIDTALQMVFIPVEKINKAKGMILFLLNKESKKATLLEIQQLCGLLNFFGKCIIPARAFTCRIYAVTSGILLPHHHLKITKELRMDLELWLHFLEHPSVYCRPFMDFSVVLQPKEVEIFTDASRNFRYGAGGICKNKFWFEVQWEESFMQDNQPSIDYLELYGATVAILAWAHLYSNQRIAILCDNMSVVHMINNNSSKCRNCMILIRLIVMHSLIHNVRIHAKHIVGKTNILSDHISRRRIKKFKELAPQFDDNPIDIPSEVWPMSECWMK